MYLQSRSIIDKIKDSIYNYFDKKGGINHKENFAEEVMKKTKKTYQKIEANIIDWWMGENV